MYLKYRYRLGYETLVKEVKDSLTWRRFCHLLLKDHVPDDTTLIKLTRRYGEDTLDELNDAIVLKLKEEKVIRGEEVPHEHHGDRSKHSLSHRYRSFC